MDGMNIMLVMYLLVLFHESWLFHVQCEPSEFEKGLGSLI